VSAQLIDTPGGIIEGDIAGIAEIRGRLRDVASLDGQMMLNRLHDISLTGQANQVRLRYPAGFFAMLDAEVVVTGDGARQQLTGEASLARACYRQPRCCSSTDSELWSHLPPRRRVFS
jgi:hypothetical protein